MPITSSVTRKFDNNYVQVEVNENKYVTRNFKLPEDNADTFQAEYKQYSKKSKRLSNISMVIGLLIGTVGSYFCTKKMNNQTAKSLIDIGVGIVGGITGTTIASLRSAKDYQKLIYKYNVTELEDSKPNFTADKNKK